MVYKKMAAKELIFSVGSIVVIPFLIICFNNKQDRLRLHHLNQIRTFLKNIKYPKITCS